MNTAAFASETRIPAYNQAAYNLAKEYWCYTQQISKEKLLLLDSIMAHISAPGQVGNIEVIVSASSFNKALSYIRDRKMTGIFDCALDTIQQEVLNPLLSKSKCEYRAKIEVKAMKVGEMPHYPTIVINIASNQDAKKYGELLYKTLASTALLCELEIVKGKADVIVRVELPDGFRARSDYIALRDSIRHQVKITQIEVNSGILVQRR